MWFEYAALARQDAWGARAHARARRAPPGAASDPPLRRLTPPLPPSSDAAFHCGRVADGPLIRSRVKVLEQGIAAFDFARGAAAPNAFLLARPPSPGGGRCIAPALSRADSVAP